MSKEQLEELENRIPFDEPLTPEQEEILSAYKLKKYGPEIQKTVDQIKEEYNNLKEKIPYQDFIEKKLKEITDQYAMDIDQINTEIQGSQAGYRLFIRDDFTPGVQVSGIPSSFPAWIPD